MGNRPVYALGGYAGVLETPSAAIIRDECVDLLLPVFNNADGVTGCGWRDDCIRECRSYRGYPDSLKGKGCSISVGIAVSLLVASHRLWHGFLMGRNQAASITEVLDEK